MASADPGRRKAWPRIAVRFYPYRWPLAGAAFLVIVAVALNMASPLLLRQVINDALPRHNTRLLVVFCLAMVVAGALSSIAAVALNIMTNSIGQRVIHGLRMDVYDRIQKMPLDFFAIEPTSEIQARMANDIGGISDIVTYTATSTLTAVVSLLAAGLAMVILSWPLAVCCGILAVALGLFNRRFTARRRDLAVRRQEEMAALLNLVGDDLALSGIILGRTFVRHAVQRSRFCLTSQGVADLTYRQRVAGSTARGVVALTMSSLPPLIYLLAGTAFRGLSLGTAVVMVTLQLRLTGPIQQLLALNGRLQSSLAMFDRVFDYLDLPSAITLGADDAGQSAGHGHAPMTIRARGIGHCYPRAGGKALAGIDLELPPGSITLVTGHTGSGKTTLGLILAGLVEPSDGVVEVVRPAAGAGTTWQAATYRQLWHDVTLVAQETVLFNASIRDNLRFAQPDATDSQLLHVACAMQIGELIAGLPAGLDTIVGERGYQLSGGERQRLALARALLATSKVLITDEATSALDGHTADAVHAALREWCRDRALVVIAHRMPPMAGQDQVIVLAEGRVAQRGTHGGLIGVGGEYRQLVTGAALRPADDRAIIQRTG
jgi:ATP-binding cassette, subfamily B, bacterial